MKKSILILIYLIAMFCTEAVAQTYSTNFSIAENPINEGGNWLNGKTDGLDWADVYTTSGHAVGTYTSGSPPYNDPTAILRGTWGSNQTVLAVVYSQNQSSNYYQEVEIRLRSTLTAHSNTGYEINFRCLKTGEAYSEIVRWNGALGDFTYLSHKDGSQYGVQDGDIVKASIVGNVITSYINGVQVAQVTDSTYRTGNPGMGFNYGVGISNTNFGFATYTATGTAPPPSGNYNLAIIKSGNGTGTVSSSPSGINCGSTCSANYNSGTVVTLTDSISGSSTFAGWRGICAGTGACVVTMNADISITATFTSPSSPGGDGAGRGRGCIATAAYGSHLDHHADVLRHFRDKYFLTNSLGQIFLKKYYRYSPLLADFIGKHDTLRTVTRWALVPIVVSIEYPYSCALILITILAILIIRKRKVKAHS